MKALATILLVLVILCLAPLIIMVAATILGLLMSVIVIFVGIFWAAPISLIMLVMVYWTIFLIIEIRKHL